MVSGQSEKSEKKVQLRDSTIALGLLAASLLCACHLLRVACCSRHAACCLETCGRWWRRCSCEQVNGSLHNTQGVFVSTCHSPAHNRKQRPLFNSVIESWSPTKVRPKGTRRHWDIPRQQAYTEQHVLDREIDHHCNYRFELFVLHF